MTELASLAGWWWHLARHYTRQAWDSLPGPWWARALLLALCLAIPGPADEIALGVLVALCRARRARREAAHVTR